jgi:2-polyprenyl-3-methyl-5-hydroxy-6-metoxy-1,4-benzoquinol methylase
MYFPELNLAEKQLISTLNWFRSRYALYQGLDLERPSTKEEIEKFGLDWIGNFKLDWDEAFKSLLEKDILHKNQNQYEFSILGSQLKEKLELDTPFYQFEYDNFYTTAFSSNAHQKFCKEVYGEDLVQHGLINMDELSILEDHLDALKPQKVLDLGCGIGKITAHLATKFPDIHFTGMDISEKGIQLAKEKNKDSANLSFIIGNLNQLENIDGKFDAFLSLDTFYYAANLESTLKQLKKKATDSATIFTYFSQWIMDESYKLYLQPDMTGLAQVLKELNLSYRAMDLTDSGIQHWKDKEAVLLKMKPEFLAEANLPLWDYRFREATRYANWGDNKYARYFYQIPIN